MTKTSTTRNLSATILETKFLNDRGVAYLKHGNLDMAMRLLRRALSKMMQHTENHVPGESPDTASAQHGEGLCSMQEDNPANPLNKDNSLPSRQRPLRSVAFDIAWYRQTNITRPTTASLVEDGLIAMYECAFLISSQDIDEQSITAALLFNLALVNHCRAVYLSQSKNLKTSLRLYEMILDIVQFQVDERNYTRSFDDLLILATLNNCAHVHSQQFHHEEAKHYLNSLRHAMSTTSLRLEDQQSALSEDDYSFFVLNAMCLHGEEVRIAPAA